MPTLAPSPVVRALYEPRCPSQILSNEHPLTALFNPSHNSLLTTFLMNVMNLHPTPFSPVFSGTSGGGSSSKG